MCSSQAVYIYINNNNNRTCFDLQVANSLSNSKEDSQSTEQGQKPEMIS